MEKERKNTGIFHNSAEVHRDSESRDLAQEGSGRHKFKCSLESDCQKHTGCGGGRQSAWALAPRNLVGLLSKLRAGLTWTPADPQHTSGICSWTSFSRFDRPLVPWTS